MKKRIIALLLAAMLLAASAPALAAEDYLDIIPISAQLGAGLPENAIAALALAEEYYTGFDFSAGSWMDIVAAVSIGIELPENVKLPEESSLASVVQMALALGRDPYTLVSGEIFALAASQDDKGFFGDNVWSQYGAMTVLQMLPVSGYDSDAAITALLSFQGSDGSFGGDFASVDDTAMALLALVGGRSSGNTATVDQAIARAQAYIQSELTGNNGFLGFNGKENSCSPATVLSAFAALGCEIDNAMVENLLSFQLADGRFIYEAGDENADPYFSTPQAIRALGELCYGSMVSRMMVTADGFYQYYADWKAIAPYAREGVMKMLNNGWMVGRGNQSFTPKGNVTKAELAQIFMNMDIAAVRQVEGDEQVPKAMADTYTDLVKGKWYINAADYVLANGLMWGENNRFEPNKVLTREEIAYWVANALQLKVSAEAKGPADINTVSAQYRTAVIACFEEGVMIGDGVNFSPKPNITRQDIATLIGRW